MTGSGKTCIRIRNGQSLHLIYWDNSNIFISAREVAMKREGVTARHRVRLHFRNPLELARAGRQIEHAITVGSVPPELRHVWNRLESRA